MNIKTRPLAVGSAAILLTLATAACGSGGATTSSDEFEFGVVAPASGSFADLGTDYTEGVKMAVAEKGTASASYCDSAGDAAQAASCGRKLSTEDQVPLIIAPLSIEVFPMMSFNAAGKSPFVLIGASASDKFVAEDNPLVARYWFNVSTYMPDFASLLAESAAEKDLPLKVGIMQSEDEYGEAWSSAFKSAWTGAGGDEVEVAKFPTNSTDVYPQLTSLLNEDPAIIAMPGACGTVTPAVKQARELGFTGPFVFAVSCTPAEMTKAVGEDAIKGSFFESSNFDLGSETITSFKEAYKEEYGEEAGILQAVGYSHAMWAMRAAEEASDPSDAASVREAMPTVLDEEWNLLALSDMQDNGEVTAPIHVRIYNSKDDIVDYDGSGS